MAKTEILLSKTRATFQPPRILQLNFILRERAYNDGSGFRTQLFRAI